MRILILFILAVTSFSLTACGGGGGGGGGSVVPTKATLKINLSGTLPAAMAGVGMTITLPANVTPELDSGAVAATVVSPSGTYAGATATTPVYTAAVGTTPATLQLALANAETAGVTQVGEVATVTLQLANGAQPGTSSFTVSNVSVIDTLGNSNSTAMSAVVASMMLQ